MGQKIKEMGKMDPKIHEFLISLNSSRIGLPKNKKFLI